MACLLVGAAFVIVREALLTLGEVPLLAAAEEKGSLAATARRVLAEGDAYTARLLLGRVLCFSAALLLTVHAVSGFESWLGALLIFGVVATQGSLVASFAALARARASSRVLRLARLMRPLELITWPLAAPLIMVGRRLSTRFRPPPSPTAGADAVREVEHMIEQGEESGSITEEFAELLLRVLDFKDTVAREVMVPRTQMTAIDVQTDMDAVLQLIVREGHSRYPVYRDRVDQIEGILYAKDLFRILKQQQDPRDIPLHSIIRRPAFFVAETHKIGQLLREMQARRFHLAVVVDEFGGTSGLVTLEDIIEEIVGEIRDEHDTEEPMAEEISKGRWSVDASMSIYDLEALLDSPLGSEKGDFDSLGGMVVEVAGRVLEVDESIEVGDFQFLVRAADHRHLTRIEVIRKTSKHDDQTLSPDV